MSEKRAANDPTLNVRSEDTTGTFTVHNADGSHNEVRWCDDKRCPKCQAVLLEDDEGAQWCSLVGCDWTNWDA